MLINEIKYCLTLACILKYWIYMKKVLRIDEVLKEKHIQQKVLANMLGVSKVSVSYWCNNQTNPSIDTLLNIAKVLKVKVSELINE